MQVSMFTDKKRIYVCTVPLESITTPWLNWHFVVATWIQNGSNILLSPIYTQYPIMPKWKHVFRNICLLKMKYRNFSFKYCSYSHAFAMTVQIELHPISFDHPWDVTTTWVHLWPIHLFGHDLERNTPVYITSQCWQCMSEQKLYHEVQITIRRAPRYYFDEAYIWGRV
jgi:hypothetical protein